MRVKALISLALVFAKYVQPAAVTEAKVSFEDISTETTMSVKEAEKQIEVLVKSISKMALQYFTRHSDINVSSKCKLTLVKMFLDLRKLKPPVIKLLDAMPKPPYGLLKGVLSIMGDYDECLEVKANEKGDVSQKKSEEVYHGQYCIVDVEMPTPLINSYIDYRRGKVNISAFGKLGQFVDLVPPIDFGKDDIHVKVGICIPSACSGEDLQQLLAFVPLPLSMRVKHCDDGRFQQLNGGQILFISFIVLLAVLVAFGTIFEMYLYSKSLVFKEHKNKCAQFLLAFSIFGNTKRLMKLQRKSADSQIPAINGMYVIGGLLVIIYHTYFTPFITSYSSHLVNFVESMNDWKFTIMSTMGISIDAFFLFSGIFMAYPRFQRETKQVKVNIFKIIVRRYLRFCPSMLMLLGIMISLSLIGSGPIWSEIFDVAATNTRKWWWTYVLMFNNFLIVKNQSFFPLWFIPCLMQLTVIGAILLWFMSRNPKLGIFLTVATCLSCNMVLGMLTYKRKYPLTYAMYYFKSRDYFEITIYTSPLSHVSPYGIGLLLGYFMAKNPTLKLQRNCVIAGWMASWFFILGTHFVCYMGHEGQDLHPTLTALYAATHRTLYTLGMSWMVLACKYGHGGIFGEFLSWKGFGVLSKLSYSLYLLHYIVIAYHVSTVRVPITFSHYETFMRYCGYITVSLVASYFLYVTFELPMSYVESLLFHGRSSVHVQKGDLNHLTNGKCVDDHFVKENGVLDSRMLKSPVWDDPKFLNVEVSKL